ncbi:MAG TPA: hypothetical protein VHQ02_02195 [Usitatibacter sp.]|jgi:hypothetical protein|nr:hypothetical protein [Usitatibacter sp.]
MAKPIGALPPEVVEAWRGGRKIDAIRLLRAKTGAGLVEAMAAMQALDHPEGKASTQLKLKGSLPEVVAALSSAGAIPPEIADAWRRGDRMAALKWLRERSRPGATPAVAKTDASPVSPGRETLSPGEVPRAKGGAWAFLVLVLVLVAVWAAFRLA